jgi:hypothetical protein
VYVRLVDHDLDIRCWPTVSRRARRLSSTTLDGRPSRPSPAWKQESFGGRRLRELRRLDRATAFVIEDLERLAVANKLFRLARIAIKADVYGNLIGTIAQKAVAGAANLIAHRSGGGCLIRASSSVARGPGEMAVVLAWRNR